MRRNITSARGGSVSPIKALAAAVLAALCLLTVLLPAQAEGEWIDLSRTGSISVTMKNKSGKAVAGGELTIYQVAAVTENDGNLSYTYTNGFEACGIDLGDLTASTLPGKLQEKLSANAAKTAVTVDKDGVARFSDLPLGLYLVVQTKAATGYNKVSSFLVSVPLTENGAYIYDVDATPKVQVYTETPATPSTPSTPTTPRLPQTGQLDWPIPVLSVLGVLLFALGWRLRRDYNGK